MSRLSYYRALMNLQEAAEAFASAIREASEASKTVETDEPIANEVLASCRYELLSAFADAPGMIQIFTGE